MRITAAIYDHEDEWEWEELPGCWEDQMIIRVSMLCNLSSILNKGLNYSKIDYFQFLNPAFYKYKKYDIIY